MSVHVSLLTEVTDEVTEAFQRLVPQLSQSARLPDGEALRRLVASPAVKLLIARSGSDVVGTLTLAMFPTPTGIRAWIEDVVVDGTVRGRGIGEALTRTALDLARAEGARTVDLTSRPSREAAGRLYERMGFEQRQSRVYRYTLG